MPKVYIVILNWNGWKDTIECLESVFQNNYLNYGVIVCDNASSDHSLEKIERWALGEIKAGCNLVKKHKGISCTSKPIQYSRYIVTQLEQIHMQKSGELSLIQVGKNLGFAGGNNIGIQCAINQNDMKYIWLLNNDTVIEKDALTKLVLQMESDESIGICGSKLLYYDQPDQVQALGGTYNRFWGISRNIVEKDKIRDMDYVVGASMLVSKEFLSTIGLMSEDYFLYYEELDWAMRSKGKFRLECATNSIVYHKEGATIGGGKDINNKSELSDYYSVRNRILFSKRYYKWYLPFVYFGLLVAIFNRIKRKQYKRIFMILNLMIGRDDRH